MKLKLFFTSILAFLLLTNSCTDDTEEIIPQSSFYAQIKLIATDPEYNQENPFIVTTDSYGNTIGNEGVVIYKQSDEEYYVFDLMCPYEKSKNSLVEISEDVFFCECPTCGSQYFIAIPDGSLTKGPSGYGLYPYNAEVRDGTLHIWN